MRSRIGIGSASLDSGTPPAGARGWRAGRGIADDY
jgi:hypothetical protein